jgi:hypothetical protein
MSNRNVLSRLLMNNAASRSSPEHDATERDRLQKSIVWSPLT